MTWRARTTYDIACDGDGCPTVAEDVDEVPPGWTVIPDHIFPGADGHLCPNGPHRP